MTHLIPHINPLSQFQTQNLTRSHRRIDSANPGVREETAQSLASIQAWIDQIFPHGVYSNTLNLDTSWLKGISKRKHEFSKGRLAAESLLGEMGIVGEIGVDQDRSPIWPSEIVGSISHSDQLLWVAVSGRNDLQSIGVDTEVIVDPRTMEELRLEIATGEEWLLFDSLHLSDAQKFSVIFSAKEAFYKCIYPLTNTYFGFQDARILHACEERVRIEMTPTNPCFDTHHEFPTALDVAYKIFDNDVLTATWISNREGN